MYVLTAVYTGDGDNTATVPICVAGDSQQAGAAADALRHHPRVTYLLAAAVLGPECIDAGYLEGKTLSNVDVFHTPDSNVVFGVVTGSLEEKLADAESAQRESDATEQAL